MTAIVYRDGVMAADSAVWQDHIICGHTRKICRLPDGRLFAASGRRSDVIACLDWLDRGAPPTGRPPPADKECGFCALLAGPGVDEVTKIEGDFRPFPAPAAAYHAIGCHTEFLLGALAAGASAEAAVALAIELGDGAGGGVQAERLEAVTQERRRA